MLNFYVPADDWHDAASFKLAAFRVDFFRPVRPYPLHEGEEQTQVLFACDRLGTDGRCMQYDDRPDVCRIFDAGSDALCVKRAPMLKGIPIVSAV